MALLRMRGRREPIGGNRVAKDAETFDFDLHDLPGLEINGRISRIADPARSSRKNQIARFQCHHIGKMSDDSGNGKNQLIGIRVLHGDAVEPE